MRLFKAIFERYKKNAQMRNDTCNNLIAAIDSALNDAKSIIPDDTSIYIDPLVKDKWQERINKVLLLIKSQDFRRLKKAYRYNALLDKQNEILDVARSIPQQILRHNEYAINVRVQAAYSIIGDVEGRKLDKQQMSCIVKDVHNHLVIAGAGTGKTTTIVGKIKYLLAMKSCLPQDILVLSFTNAAAAEMSKRITDETGQNISASTFHKLGLNIITQVNGIMPKITQINLRQFIKEQLTLNMKSDAYLNLLSTYLLFNHVVSKSEFEFRSQDEYTEYLKLNPPVTINHETVKSYGEMDIANFLAQNNVYYIYESPYEIDTRTDEYGQYHPDFYLPDYKIYIEYFGVDRNNEVPTYFKSSDGITASEVYRASMEWKRSIHRKYQTTMIECYAYEKLEGNLLDALKAKLCAVGVPLVPKSSKELWEKISSENDSILYGIVKLFETLINLIKSNGYDIEIVRSLNHGGTSVYANNLLLTLLEPIFNSYCKYLVCNSEIDFSDMINTASEYIRQGKYVNRYKYVIVDEYQDVSKAHFILLDCMRKSGDYDLFCVGDDWQSIYRFAGSDIDFILNFSKYWPSSEVSKIETTYRFTQKLIEISSGFIMRNPAQIKKSIQGKTEDFGFPLAEISGYTDNAAMKLMSKRLRDIPKGSSVFFIGRYSFDFKLLTDCGLFTCQYNNKSGLIDVKSTVRPDLDMIFLTAHKSKGLQADYVFIINNKNSRMGFPSKIQDAPILDLLLNSHDRYPHAEERRLFYVALTRAKKKVFIITVSRHKSEFAVELREQYGEQLRKEQFECPLCGGRLVKRSGPYGEFLGCSNYRLHGCTYKRKIGG